mmetsp:Transcript_32758/g.84974  ORF Transcript_32758/g.84974 Transcript_32758/m.84974 type:complete len:219 (+) Transcript_32758:14-670(+)
MAFSLNPAVQPDALLDDGSDDLPKDLKLKHTWNFWEQLNQGAQGKSGYAESTRKFGTCSTVEEFWSMFSDVPQPSQLFENRMARVTPDGAAALDGVMLFKDGVRPEWEDPANAAGGHFQVQLLPSLGAATIDEFWNNIVMGCIGNTLDLKGLLTGVRLVDKLGSRTANIRLEVWFRCPVGHPDVLELRQVVKDCMHTRLDGTLTKVKTPALEIKSHVT